MYVHSCPMRTHGQSSMEQVRRQHWHSSAFSQFTRLPVGIGIGNCRCRGPSRRHSYAVTVYLSGITVSLLCGRIWGALRPPPCVYCARADATAALGDRLARVAWAVPACQAACQRSRCVSCPPFPVSAYSQVRSTTTLRALRNGWRARTRACALPALNPSVLPPPALQYRTYCRRISRYPIGKSGCPEQPITDRCAPPSLRATKAAGPGRGL